MKFFLLILLALALLWIASIAWANRRKSSHGNRDGGSGGDSGGGSSPSGCDSSDGGCGGGGD